MSLDLSLTRLHGAKCAAWIDFIANEVEEWVPDRQPEKRIKKFVRSDVKRLLQSAGFDYLLGGNGLDAF